MGERWAFLVTPIPGEGGAEVERVQAVITTGGKPERSMSKVGELEYRAICDFLRDAMNGYHHGMIVPLRSETDRAWSEGAAAVIAELALLEDADAGGEIVHQAWYQAMTMQGRAVPVDRRAYEILDTRDQLLDEHIARIVLQQAALVAETNARAARATGDEPAGEYVPVYADPDIDPIWQKWVPRTVTGTAPAEYLYRQMETEGKSSESLALNLTNSELALLVTDARRERDDAETRHAKSEEQRRKDNGAWKAERADWRDKLGVVQQTLNELRGDHEAAAATIKDLDMLAAERQETINRQAREASGLWQTIADCRREIAALRDRLGEPLDGTHDLAIGDYVEPERTPDGSPLSFTLEQARFFGRAADSVPQVTSEYVAIAVMSNELAAVRTLTNNPASRDGDPVGLTKRLATIAACAYALHHMAGTPVQVDASAPKP